MAAIAVDGCESGRILVHDMHDKMEGVICTSTAGGFQGVTISTSTPEELESPFKAFHYPGQPRQY